MININKFSISATAAIITSLALIAGFAHGNDGQTSIVAGLLVIAIADNIVDSLGIHIYKEAEGACKRETNSSTLGNFTVRLIFALNFVCHCFVVPSSIALIVSAVWGLFLLIILSYFIAMAQKVNPLKQIIWHLLVALLVIMGSKLLGNLILKEIAQ